MLYRGMDEKQIHISYVGPVEKGTFHNRRKEVRVSMLGDWFRGGSSAK